MNESQINKLPAQEKRYRRKIEGHLYIEVRPTGGKTWQIRQGNVFKKIGSWPQMRLKSALNEVKHKPSKRPNLLTFQEISEDFYNEIARSLKRNTKTNLRTVMDMHLFPVFGDRFFDDIQAMELYEFLMSTPTTVRGRIKSFFSRVAKHAIMMGMCERDITNDIALPATRGGRLPSINKPEVFGRLLNDIDQFTGHLPLMICLQLTPLLALRPRELREGLWNEIEWDAGQWRIPGERMKAGLEHIIPLPKQAIEKLKLLKSTGKNNIMFWGLRGGPSGGYISHLAVNKALKDMGWNNEICAHGFRHTFSTMLNELGENRDHIEIQLAHRITGVRGVYNGATYLSQRADMMQRWADHLDQLKRSPD